MNSRSGDINLTALPPDLSYGWVNMAQRPISPHMADADLREPLGEVEYMVLGCGSIGYNVIEELESETRSILVVDRDEKRVKDLLDQNYDAVTGDIKDPALFDTLQIGRAHV